MLGLWIALAGAAPVELTWQGRVLDATGAPIDGQRELTLTLYDAPTGGAVLHDEQFPDHPVQDGYATVRLGVAEPLDSAALRGEVYVDLAVDGVLLGPRTPLADAPRAGVARDLDGGTARLGDLDVACCSSAATTSTSSASPPLAAPRATPRRSTRAASTSASGCTPTASSTGCGATSRS